MQGAYLGIYALTSFGMYLTFQKLGEKGWKGIVPIYRQYVALRLGGEGLAVLVITGFSERLLLADIITADNYVNGIHKYDDSILQATAITALLSIIFIVEGLCIKAAAMGRICMRLGHSKWLGILFVLVPCIMWPVAGLGGTWTRENGLLLQERNTNFPG